MNQEKDRAQQGRILVNAWLVKLGLHTMLSRFIATQKRPTLVVQCARTVLPCQIQLDGLLDDDSNDDVIKQKGSLQHTQRQLDTD